MCHTRNARVRLDRSDSYCKLGTHYEGRLLSVTVQKLQGTQGHTEAVYGEVNYL